MKAWQGSYGISPYDGIVSPAYFVFDTDYEYLPYFHLAIRSRVYINFFAQSSDGIRVGQWDLDTNKMKEIPFFVPPLSEQQAIVAYIEEQTEKINRQKEKIHTQISFLQEYRTRLISDVVTGQIDVRDVVNPDYIAESYAEELGETDENEESEVTADAD